MPTEEARIDSSLCAVLERTADGIPVGRCWFFVGDRYVCPRHGDVSEIQKHYQETGELTLEPVEG